ncbi:GTPase [Nocardioides sp. GCM10027113]|uniref:GTPase n=1 Tax=unclassified Nocardioides TaxID=2615069 RepID=UPI00361E6569
MTSLVEGAKRLVTRGSDLGTRIAGLETAVEAARGRLDETLVEDVAAVAERAAGRLRLSAEHTVVALAGATGSGKSSTFNQLTGLELSAVGVRRPTTSWATACVWGREGADELLEWLGIPARHQVTRDSLLDTAREDDALDGVVLLDLPDHDSTEVSHHLEVDRLVELADLLVWVLDPQKYADAALHDRYLVPLATHQDVMMVVLNQIDAVPEAGREPMVADVRAVLDREGLTDVPVMTISAKQGHGIAELRAEIARRVSAKKATKARLEADVKAAAARLEEASGTAKARTLGKDRVQSLEEALADVAGVPTVVAAVEKSTRMRAGRATGWPVTSWFTKLRPDPLRRLHLDLGEEGKQLTGRSRSSVPAPTQVQRARVDSEVRTLADDVSTGLARPWADAIRAASLSRLSDLTDRLDGALTDTDLGVAKLPVWAGLVRVLQWLLIVSALTGAAWLGFLAVAAYLQLPQPPLPDVSGVPLPTLLLLGGVGLGILLALASRVLVGVTARRRARNADRRLRKAVSEVCHELVVAPVEAELDAYGRTRTGLADALR